MRLIDADELLTDPYFQDESIPEKDMFIEAVEDSPTIDAVEVVRCRDCIAFGKSPYGHPGLGWCRIYGHHFKPDYFCASGRREVERDE